MACCNGETSSSSAAIEAELKKDAKKNKEYKILLLGAWARWEPLCRLLSCARFVRASTAYFVCVCVRACVRPSVRACVRVCVRARACVLWPASFGYARQHSRFVFIWFAVRATLNHDARNAGAGESGKSTIAKQVLLSATVGAIAITPILF